MKRPFFISLLIFLMAGLGQALQAQTAAEIIAKAEEIRRGISSSEAEMTMTIVRPKWTRSMSMKSWSKGDDYSLVLITGPERDKGSATLKRGKEVWNWMPKIERTIKLPPSMMSQSWMGSDLTNEDLVREVSIVRDYDHKMLQDSTVEGRKCWKLELIPHEDVPVVWGKIHVWVDQADYLQLLVKYYDEDGYLVNVMSASNIQNMGGRPFTQKMTITPVEEEGHSTILEYKSLKFDGKMPEAFFSVQNMKRVR